MQDRIYASAQPVTPFVFDEEVAGVFDDMVERSIPGYRTSLQLIAALAPQLLENTPRVGYDLGCALGQSTLAMLHSVTHPECRVIAVDNAKPMLKRLDEKLQSKNETRITLQHADLCNVDLQPASMIVLHFTLHFLPMEYRNQLLVKCADALSAEGGLLLFEKVSASDTIEKAHHRLKSNNGYSQLEIANKRHALEEVLTTESAQAHRARLHASGFSRITNVFTALNFSGWLAQL